MKHPKYLRHREIAPKKKVLAEVTYQTPNTADGWEPRSVCVCIIHASPRKSVMEVKKGRRDED